MNVNLYGAVRCDLGEAALHRLVVRHVHHDELDRDARLLRHRVQLLRLDAMALAREVNGRGAAITEFAPVTTVTGFISASLLVGCGSWRSRRTRRELGQRCRDVGEVA